MDLISRLNHKKLIFWNHERKFIWFHGNEITVAMIPGTDLNSDSWFRFHDSLLVSHQKRAMNLQLSRMKQFYFQILTNMHFLKLKLTNQNGAHQKSNQKQESKSWWIGIIQRYVTLRILEKQKKSVCLGESLGTVLWKALSLWRHSYVINMT